MSTITFDSKGVARIAKVAAGRQGVALGCDMKN